MDRPSRGKNFRRAVALALAAVVLLGASAPSATTFSQQRPAQAPTPPQPPPQQQPTGDDQDETISVNTNLVQVDAVVLDRRGRQVTDLTAADFEIVEDGRARQPEFCSYVSAEGGRSAPASAEDGRLAPNEVRRSIVFLVANPLIEVKNNVINDERPFATVPSSVFLSQAVTNANAAEKVLSRFVEQQMGAHDLAAIRETEGPSVPLGALTTDRALLRRAIERVGENPVKKAPKVTVVLGESRTMLLRPLVEQNLRVLQMMDDAVEQLSRLPGRRVLVLVSRGMLYSLRELGVESIIRRMDEVIAKANRARVTFYTLNPRGPSEANLRGGGLQDNHGLMTLARETGGRAIFNANDLTVGFSSVLEENRGYYLLGYNPGADAAARPHNIKVNVRRSDLRVQARATAYAAPAADLRGPVSRPQLGEALESPLALRGLKLALTPLYLSADGRTARIMSLVNIDLRNAEWATKPDGARTTNLDVVGRVIAPDGRVLFQKGRGYALSVPPADFERTLARGLDYWFDVGADNPGLYQISVAVRDAATGRAGNAVEFVEASDLTRAELSASSLLLSAVADGAATVPSGFAGEENFAAFARREFPSGGTLRYQLYVYYSPRGRRGEASGLQVQATIKRGGVVQAALPARSVTETGTPAFVGGDIALAGLPAGRYTLEVTISERDSREGRSASVSSDFQITK